MKLMWLNVSLLVITKTNIFFIAKISNESDNNEQVIWLEALLLVYACNETIGKRIFVYSWKKKVLVHNKIYHNKIGSSYDNIDWFSRLKYLVRITFLKISTHLIFFYYFTF